VCLQVGNQAVGVGALLLMPDEFVEDEFVADVGVPRRHEPRQRGKGVVVGHRLDDWLVIPVTEDDPAAHQVVRVLDRAQNRLELLDAELLEEFAVVRDRRGAPRVQRNVLDSAVGPRRCPIVTPVAPGHLRLGGLLCWFVGHRR